MAKTTITAKVDAAIVDRLDKLAERLGITRSECIENCLGFGLDGGERFAARLEMPIMKQLMRFVMNLEEDDQEAIERFNKMVKATQSCKTAGNKKLKTQA